MTIDSLISPEVKEVIKQINQLHLELTEVVGKGPYSQQEELDWLHYFNEREKDIKALLK